MSPDSLSMEAMIASLPDQLETAAEAGGTPLEAAIGKAGEAVMVGMGGSGIGADFASTVAAAAHRRVTVWKAYGLPKWASEARPIVIATSFSGNTEETLDSVETALGLDLPVAVVTGGGRLGELANTSGLPVANVPSGLQPRAALGHLLGAQLRYLQDAGFVSAIEKALHEAASVTRGLLGAMCDGSGRPLADDLAARMKGHVVAVTGSHGLTAPVAQRWKTQINENAKAPAWWSELPESNHNELAGWLASTELSADRVTNVFLRDRGEDSRVASRFAHTQSVIREATSVAGEVWSKGNDLLARLLSLVAIGDMVSLSLAGEYGVDPIPVEMIENLKQRLKEGEK